MIAQIAALPRSGTAWVTTMLNLGARCTAVHELAATDRRWRRTVQRGADACHMTDRVFVDVGTYQCLPAASRTDSMKVYIRQDPETSRRRAERAFGYDPGGLHEMACVGMQWAEKHSAMVVESCDLFRLRTLRKLWGFVNPFEPFPAAKVEDLMGMKIERLDGARLFSPEAATGWLSELGLDK